jgi:hypothetical protein
LDGDQIDFTIRCGGSVGVYSGFIDDQGFMSGNTHDANHRESRAHWKSLGDPVVCVQRHSIQDAVTIHATRIIRIVEVDYATTNAA